MKLLDLPVELFQAVMAEVVLVRGLKRSLRIRIVCKLFDQEVKEAIFALRMLDNAIIKGRDTPGLFAPYLERRVLQRKDFDKFPRLSVIWRIAERLACKDENGSTSEMALKYYVRELCTFASMSRHRTLKDIFCQQPVEIDGIRFQQCLLAAACYTNKVSLVRQLLKQSTRPYPPNILFDNAVLAAVRGGHRGVLDIIFEIPCIYSRSGSKKELIAALREASRGGQLEMVDYIIHSLPWPFDLEDHLTCFQIEKAFYTPNLEIFRRIMAFRMKSKFHELVNKDLLRNVVSEAIEFGWTDVANHLLHQGYQPLSPRAFVEACRKGYTEIVKTILKNGYEIVGPEMFAAAAAGGYTDTIKLLLDYGADTEGSMATAARMGRTKAVKMLLDHGIELNTGTGVYPAPIVSAIEREDTAMFKLLVHRGAILHTPETGEMAMKLACAQGLDTMRELLEVALSGDLDTSAEDSLEVRGSKKRAAFLPRVVSLLKGRRRAKP
ncbi:ankyrin repeat-containing domain protein [Clohesyomyces aquaticus]|uniref:Ankyrin repeat-containing domain protein n=1 Tax=Clohesyomyces aquaticus TaxID=1231657 RepID=A0A1Y1Y8X4_9PLEO|nr:ankyrin repeat-containing domain protein [Clohesyomyces aquaticus]